MHVSTDGRPSKPEPGRILLTSSRVLQKNRKISS